MKDGQQDPQQEQCHKPNSTSKEVGVKPEGRWICQVDDLVASAEFIGKEAIRVLKRDVRRTQLDFLIRVQRSMAIIQNLIQAVPDGGTKGE
jgi:hypothetical protein